MPAVESTSEGHAKTVATRIQPIALDAVALLVMVAISAPKMLHRSVPTVEESSIWTNALQLSSHLHRIPTHTQVGHPALGLLNP